MVEEEPAVLNTPCTTFEWKRLSDDYVVYLAIFQHEGAAEEVFRRGLGHLLTGTPE